MFVTEINLWNAVLVAVIVIVALIVFFILDRKMIHRMGLVYGVTLAQMILVGIVIWLTYKYPVWWTYLLWFLVVPALSTCWVLYPLQAMVSWKKMLLPVATAVFTGSIMVAGCALLILPLSVFMTVYSVLLACMTASLIQTSMNYLRSLERPEKEQESSLMENILPKVRSMVSPLIMTVPTLYAGMMMGGIPGRDSLFIVLLLLAFAFVTNVVSGIVLQLVARQQNKKSNLN